jgi:hypothetical protein
VCSRAAVGVININYPSATVWSRCPYAQAGDDAVITQQGMICGC